MTKDVDDVMWMPDGSSRFAIYANDFPRNQMVTDADGEWVRLEDALAEVARLENELDAALATAADRNRERLEMAAEIRTLRNYCVNHGLPEPIAFDEENLRASLCKPIIERDSSSPFGWSADMERDTQGEWLHVEIFRAYLASARGGAAEPGARPFDPSLIPDCPSCRVAHWPQCPTVMQEFHNIDDVAEIRRLRRELQEADALLLGTQKSRGEP